MKNSSGNISMNNNPLYPPKKESDAKGVLIAVASVIIAIICLVLIVSHFSYAAHPERMGSGWGAGNTVQTGGNDIQQEDMQAEDIGGNGSEDIDSDETYQQFTSDGMQDQQTVPDMQDQQTGSQSQQMMPDSQDMQENGDYILPNSSTMYLSRSDIEHLSQEQLRIARNEIFARHGRMFSDEELQQYFDSKEWYSGTVSPDAFDADVLNDCERANATLIQSYEEEMGYR